MSDDITDLDPPSTPVGGDALDDPRVLAVVQEYMAELDQGRQPDRHAYVGRYPELSGAVTQCLDGLDLVRGVAPRSSAAGSARPPVNEPAPRALGDFQIVRELGRGGMGVVYEAVQLSLGRRVALKVLPFAATFDARQLQRFKNEAQAAALLHHTNIVPIYAVGCERGVHFYAMQLIEGHSLAVLIRQLREQAGLVPPESKSGDWVGGMSLTQPFLAGVVPTAPARDEQLRSTAGASLTITARAVRGNDNHYQKVARLMLQTAEALEHAHQVGIVHRDIKPANLLIDAAGTLWIADFGLAQFQADASLTRTGDLVGTYRYMSPEQASGQRTAIDHRTDIYSLGSTFYELLTLQPVFAGDTRHELLYQILHDEPKPLRQINRAIPVELETIVLKAVRKAPAERYASAADLAEDLRRFLDHRPILARPPTTIDRLRKWSRRHPSVVVGGVAVLAVCLVAASIGNWRSAVARASIAEEQRKTAEALTREEQRANEAEELFRQARQAVDVLVEVSEDELSDNFMMTQTRRRLLQTALGFYQDFIDERRGDAASQADLAAVEQRVTGILGELELLRRDMQVKLLREPIVIRELGLNEKQKQQVSELLRAWDDEEQSLWSEVESLDEEDRRHRFAALAEQRAPALERVLTDAQLQRLRQLNLQSQGLWAFREPEVVAALDLTRDQRLAIRRIEREQFRHGPDHDHGPPPPPEGQEPPEPRDRGNRKRRDRGPREREGMTRRPPPSDSREAMLKVQELLSAEQLERWLELTGSPVEGLDSLRFHRPPPHGRKPPKE